MILGGIVGLEMILGSAIKVTRGVEHKHSKVSCYRWYSRGALYLVIMNTINPTQEGTGRYLYALLEHRRTYSATLHIHISVSNTQIGICRSDPGTYSYASHPQNACARWTRMMKGFSAVIESILITEIDTIVA